ncbi:hypothetical protein N658DRAFT_185214 [Parathielavia hyrcaniae]|uniref:Secreted protein n=1 Tax=Parathielavia hyrcaniae TaxID=113614 RepID=A0AAN6Q825_9PEZI|nr:hypothetical protein N658DRAFT_185214 [Parathielavia hyrcaniae]
MGWCHRVNFGVEWLAVTMLLSAAGNRDANGSDHLMLMLLAGRERGYESRSCREEEGLFGSWNSLVEFPWQAHDDISGHGGQPACGSPIPRLHWSLPRNLLPRSRSTDLNISQTRAIINRIYFVKIRLLLLSLASKLGCSLHVEAP